MKLSMRYENKITTMDRVASTRKLVFIVKYWRFLIRAFEKKKLHFRGWVEIE